MGTSVYCPAALRPSRGIAQQAEGQGKVGAVGGHALQQVLGQRPIALALGEQAKLAAQAGSASRLKLQLKRGERRFGRRQRSLCASRLQLEKRQQRFGETRKIP